MRPHLRLEFVLVDGQQRAADAGVRAAERHDAAARLGQNSLQLRLVYLLKTSVRQMLCTISVSNKG